jgi:hypothetical protein
MTGRCEAFTQIRRPFDSSTRADLPFQPITITTIPDLAAEFIAFLLVFIIHKHVVVSVMYIIEPTLPKSELCYAHYSLLLASVTILSLFTPL